MQTLLEMPPLSESDADKLHRLWQLAKGTSADRIRAAQALRAAEAKELNAHDQLRSFLNQVAQKQEIH